MITLHTPDTIEISNCCADTKKSDEKPSVLLHASTWNVDEKLVSGIAVEVFGCRAPLIVAADARMLAQWLREAADYLEDLSGK